MLKMNDYDYNKMLEELELMEIRDKNKKEKVIKLMNFDNNKIQNKKFNEFTN